MSKISDDQLKQLEESAKNSAKTKGGELDPDQIAEDFEQMMQDLEDSTDDLVESKKKEQEESENATKTSKKTRGAFDGLGKASSMLMTGLGMLAGKITSQMNMVTELNKSGMNLGRNTDGAVGGMNSFISSATEANLSLTELSEVSKKYAMTINRIGVAQFGPMVKSLTTDLQGLGVSSAESAELMGEYLDQQRLQGTLDKLTTAEHQAKAAKQIKQADLWSKTLGKSREEILKGMAASKGSITTEAFLQTANEGVRDSMNVLAMSLGAFDPEFSKQVQDAISQPITAQSELFQSLSQAGAAQAADELNQLSMSVKSGSLTQEQAEAKMMRFVSSLQKVDTEMALNIGAQGQAALSAKNLSTQIIDQTKAAKAEMTDAQKQAAAMTKATETLKMFTNMFDRVVGSLFSNDEFIKELTTSIEQVSETFRTLIPPIMKTATMLTGLVAPLLTKLASLFAKVVGVIDGPVLTAFDFLAFTVGMGVDGLIGLIDWFGKLTFDNIGDNIDELGNNLGKLAAGIAAITGTIMAKNALMAAGGGMKDAMMDKLGYGSEIDKDGKGKDNKKDNKDDKKPKKQRKPKGGKSPKGGLGQMFKGLSAGIGGVMEGLALGLKSFGKGSGQILLGATVLSGVIVILAAGIGAAAWVISKALPAVAEGMKPMEELDGDALVSAGLGIAAIGAGMASLGAGSAIGAVGGAVGSLVEGISGMIGAKSSIEKLEEFAAIGPELEQAGNGITMLSEGLLTLGPALNGLTDVEDASAGMRKLSTEISMVAPSLEQAGAGALKLANGLYALGPATEHIPDMSKVTSDIGSLASSLTVLDPVVDNIANLADAGTSMESLAESSLALGPMISVFTELGNTGISVYTLVSSLSALGLEMGNISTMGNETAKISVGMETVMAMLDKLGDSSESVHTLAQEIYALQQTIGTLSQLDQTSNAILTLSGGLLSLGPALESLSEFDKIDDLSTALTLLSTALDSLPALDKLSELANITGSFKGIDTAVSVTTKINEINSQLSTGVVDDIKTASGAIGKSGLVKPVKPTAIKIPETKEVLPKNDVVEKAPGEVPISKAAEPKEDAINTILEKQTVLLEMLVSNSSSQVSSLNKLRKSSEENY